MITVNAMGDNCPIPVIKTKKAMDALTGPETIEVLVDNETNRIAASAPLFDHGNSLFNLAGLDVWENQKSFDRYAAAQLPRVYDDFFVAARDVMAPRHGAMLRKLLDFRFDRRATRYNLPPQRLKMLEREVQRRARVMLAEGTE